MILALATLALACQQTLPSPLQVEQLANGLRYRIDEIPAASHVCVLLGLRTGNLPDQNVVRGMAEVYAAALNVSLPRAGNRQAEVQVKGTALLVLQIVPRAELPAVLAGVHDLLSRPLPIDEDGFDLARARARLSADDATQVYPGSILVDRARRLLLPDEHLGLALPEEIFALSLAALEDWQARRIRAEQCFVFLLGGLSSGAGEDLIRAHFAGLPAGSPVPAALARGPAGRGEHPPLRSSHRQVLAPFVSMAVPAPPSDSPDALAFAVGMELLRQRASFEFRSYRAGEARAGFPFLDYSIAEQTGVALINRRGFNGDATAQVIAEIRGLVTPIIEYGFRRDEVQRAAERMAAGLRLPPYSTATQQAMQRQWRMLYTKALVLAAYASQGWPQDLGERLENVQAEDVNRVLRQQMAPEQSLWLALEPISR